MTRTPSTEVRRLRAGAALNTVELLKANVRLEPGRAPSGEGGTRAPSPPPGDTGKEH